MKTQSMMFGVVVASFAAYASGPRVDLNAVTVSQDASSHRVTVKYTLTGEPGIVTLDIQTNAAENVWESIGDDKIRSLAGAVNRRVDVLDRESEIYWFPNKDWPGQTITGGKLRAVVKAWSTNAPPDVMVVDLVVGGDVRYFPSLDALPGGIQDHRYKTECLVLRKCPAEGVRWRMGSPSSEPNRHWDSANREQLHAVTLTNDFYIGVYEVTQGQYKRVMESQTVLPGEQVNPAYFSQAEDWETRPVETVTYDGIRGNSDGHEWLTKGHAVDSGSWLGKLRTHAGGGQFDLPLDAEWEFACRAGTGTGLNNETEFSTVDDLCAVARCYYNSNPGAYARTTPASESGTSVVGSYGQNQWGLYDMHGNVWEICLDWYVKQLATVDPCVGATTGNMHPRRGGSWAESTTQLCRSAARSDVGNTSADMQCGFRVACSALACP